MKIIASRASLIGIAFSNRNAKGHRAPETSDYWGSDESQTVHE
jgi:hypothetical protein